MQNELIGYQLVEEVALRSKDDGEIFDWQWTIVAEGKTPEGLVKFARLKKLKDDRDKTFFIESKEKEYIPCFGYREDSGNLYKKYLSEL